MASHKSFKIWSPEELSKLESMYHDKSISLREIADATGHSELGVSIKADRLGIYGKWSTEEIDELKRMWSNPHVKVRTICQRLKRLLNWVFLKRFRKTAVAHGQKIRLSFLGQTMTSRQTFQPKIFVNQKRLCTTWLKNYLSHRARMVQGFLRHVEQWIDSSISFRVPCVRLANASDGNWFWTFTMIETARYTCFAQGIMQ